jgi:sirohydrochlorin ferrochelatase
LTHSAAGAHSLLIAAHGERRSGAGNEGVAELAARLAACRIALKIGFGFLKGSPSIADAVRRLAARDLLVYPLFLSDGYFTRTLLPRQLKQAGAFDRGRAARLLPPLGLDPALPDLILNRACFIVRAQGWPPAHTRLVLLAHGSSNNSASRRAAERIAAGIAMMRIFGRVRPAFLEEPPFLQDAVATPGSPAVVVGLFAGEGLHGGGDAPKLVDELARSEVVFAGNVGGFETLPEVIAAAIRRRENAIATSARADAAARVYVCR